MNVRTVTLVEVQESHRTLCLWNGEGWTRCWMHSGLAPIHEGQAPPKRYKNNGDSKAVMTRRAKNSFMFRADLEESRLAVIAVPHSPGESRFVIARMENRPCA